MLLSLLLACLQSDRMVCVWGRREVGRRSRTVIMHPSIAPRKSNFPRCFLLLFVAFGAGAIELPMMKASRCCQTTAIFFGISLAFRAWFFISNSWRWIWWSKAAAWVELTLARQTAPSTGVQHKRWKREDADVSPVSHSIRRYLDDSLLSLELFPCSLLVNSFDYCYYRCVPLIRYIFAANEPDGSCGSPLSGDLFN